MLVVETTARIRREYFVKGKTIKEITRDLGVARNTVRRVLRSCHSRMLFVRAYPRETQEVFDDHDRAFALFKGTCRRGIYDNMKTAVAPGRPNCCRAFALVRSGETIYDPWHYVPALARKPGALRNGAPFKDRVLPAAMERVRRKLASADDGNRQMVNISPRCSLTGCRRLKRPAPKPSRRASTLLM
jgi:hypothetical protein